MKGGITRRRTGSAARGVRLAASPLAGALSPEERAVIRKAAIRLVPFLCLLYFVAFLDRVNIGFAALTMRRDIGLSASAYGFAAGIFFIGYFIFELPSNLLLERFGARRWIARIMVSWGLVSIGTAFVRGPASFYTLRLLLGVAEAGFFPGIVLYLTRWFPGPARAAMVGWFILANPLTSVLGAPISTALLQTQIAGLAGWQTMFIVEGVPAVILGLAVPFWISDSPRQARWLAPSERETLQAALDREVPASVARGLRAGLASPRVWLYAAIYFGLNLGVYGFGFWAPQMLKTLGGFTLTQTGLVTVVPYACAALTLVLWGRHSDASGERIGHLALPALAGAAAFAIGAATSHVAPAIVCFTLGAMGIYAGLPVFWTLPAARLADTAAAGGIALINSIGTLAGFVGPVLIGSLEQATGGYQAGLIAVAVSLAAAGVLGLAAG